MTNRVPIKGKYTPEQIQEVMTELYNEALSHVGRRAVFLQRETRYHVPYIVTVESVNKHNASLTYKCYNANGDYTGLSRLTLDYVKLFIGEQKIIYFEDARGYNMI